MRTHGGGDGWNLITLSRRTPGHIASARETLETPVSENSLEWGRPWGLLRVGKRVEEEGPKLAVCEEYLVDWSGELETRPLGLIFKARTSVQVQNLRRLKRIENKGSDKSLYMCIHSSASHNHHKVETTQMSINR